MTLPLVIACLTQPLTVGVVLWFLTKQQDRTWREVQVLMNRIQSPETAVAQTLVREEPELDLRPDSEWTEADAHERLMSTYVEGA